MTSTLFAVALLIVCVSASAQDTESGEPPAVVAPVAPRTPAGTMAKGSRNAARVNLIEAQRRLAQAQEKRSLGIEPLPGERYSIGGAEKVTHRYWRRQESLRLQVEVAQQRLNAIREPQPQLARR